MCVIAGYAGHRCAAPILIDMMKKVEYIDGGLSTGIATVHEGKLYTAKVLGDVDTLLATTDALDFPGTCGIIHTRPSGDFQSHAHPFISEDGDLAFCENGTYFQATAPEFADKSRRLMGDYYRRGVTIKSAFDVPDHPDYAVGYLRLPNGKGYHNAEVYAQTIGEAVKDTPSSDLADAIARSTSVMLSRLPAELVTLSVHARLPDTVTVGRVTRPMAVGYGDGETYLCTTPIGFPEEIGRRPVTFLPTVSVSQITPKGLRITNYGIPGVRVEEVDARITAYLRPRIEAVLAGKKDAPVPLCGLGASAWHKEMWHEPMTDCHIVAPMGHLKATAAAVYETLWSFFREGRLGMTVGKDDKGNLVTEFYLEGAV